MTAVGCLEAEAAVLGCLLALPLQPAKDVAWTLDVDDFTDRTVPAVAEVCCDGSACPDRRPSEGEQERGPAVGRRETPRPGE